MKSALGGRRLRAPLRPPRHHRRCHRLRRHHHWHRHDQLRQPQRLGCQRRPYQRLRYQHQPSQYQRLNYRYQRLHCRRWARSPISRQHLRARTPLRVPYTCLPHYLSYPRPHGLRPGPRCPYQRRRPNQTQRRRLNQPQDPEPARGAGFI